MHVTHHSMKAEVKGGKLTPSISSFQNHNSPPLFNTSHTLKGCLGSLDGACIEKLLLHCASALESNDVTLAQQVMWVLNNVASPTGDTNQRLTSWFLRALINRASMICPTAMNFKGTNNRIQRRLMTITELAGYVDLIPWHRFGFCASNNQISKAISGFQKVHIIDFSITHCMQWPTFIDGLAKRPEGPPSLRITVPSIRPRVPPLVNVSTHEVGIRLANFAKFRDVPFEFNIIGNNNNTVNPLSSNSELVSFDELSSNNTSCLNFESLLNLLNPDVLNIREDEVLVINVQNWLRYLCDDRKGYNSDFHQSLSLRDAFLNLVKGLNPRILMLVDEDCDLSSPSLTSRITTCFNHLWIPFDALETFLPKDSSQRTELESDVGQKIENIISYEGDQRVERMESGVQMCQRMRNAGYSSVPFCQETVGEVKELLDEHASGWGMKREDGMLVLTWKGNSCVFATAWVPSPEIRDPNLAMDACLPSN